MARRKPTSTSSFGVSRRENHDATAFYARFGVPTISRDATVARPAEVDLIHCGDARHMDLVAPDSVALVVTSPPYFAGKRYEEALGDGRVPASYVEYLEMLEDVFGQCVTKLEAGGRIAVNVANLGRKPYRSLAADVIAILQDRLGLLLRGEIVWQKARGAGGSCAWGSFQSPANPVLRDVTERVIVASKGRFDRSVARRDRELKGLPSAITISKDEFMDATLDLWDIPPESATRVGHPAPFPVELPMRLIELYTYEGDLVLDPFIGSGTTAVASVRSGRHYLGYDLDPGYVQTARARVAAEGNRSRAVREGRRAREVALELLATCGFHDIVQEPRMGGGVEVTLAATDGRDRRWLFDVSGAFTTTRAGLRRMDTLWKTLGKAAVLSASKPGQRLILLTTGLPPAGSAGRAALRAGRGSTYHDAIELLSLSGHERLRLYATGHGYDRPLGDLLDSGYEDGRNPSA